MVPLERLMILTFRDSWLEAFFSTTSRTAEFRLTLSTGYFENFR